MKVSLGVCLLSFLLLISCANKEDKYEWKSLDVIASAYNSVRSQTNGKPSLAAWGDTLVPGMKCIAISQDLLQLGIDHNTPIKIEGLKGIFLVKDKMNQRYTKKIDIYMDKDIEKAEEWGIKKLTIQYRVAKESTEVEIEIK